MVFFVANVFHASGDDGRWNSVSIKTRIVARQKHCMSRKTLPFIKRSASHPCDPNLSKLLTTCFFKTRRNDRLMSINQPDGKGGYKQKAKHPERRKTPLWCLCRGTFFLHFRCCYYFLKKKGLEDCFCKEMGDFWCKVRVRMTRDMPSDGFREDVSSSEVRWFE